MTLMTTSSMLRRVAVSLVLLGPFPVSTHAQQSTPIVPSTVESTLITQGSAPSATTKPANRWTRDNVSTPSPAPTKNIWGKPISGNTDGDDISGIANVAAAVSSQMETESRVPAGSTYNSTNTAIWGSRDGRPTPNSNTTGPSPVQVKPTVKPEPVTVAIPQLNTSLKALPSLPPASTGSRLGQSPLPSQLTAYSVPPAKTQAAAGAVPLSAPQAESSRVQPTFTQAAPLPYQQPGQQQPVEQQAPLQQAPLQQVSQQPLPQQQPLVRSLPSLAPSSSRAQSTADDMQAAHEPRALQLPVPTNEPASRPQNLTVQWTVPPVQQTIVEPAPLQIVAPLPVNQPLGNQATLNQATINQPTWVFNFHEAPWGVVIRNFAKANQYALHMQVEPQGNFTFVDERAYEVGEALDLLNDYLLPQGFLLVRQGTKLSAVTTSTPISDTIVPFVALADIEMLGRNEMAAVAFPLKDGDPNLVISEVRALLSAVGNVRVLSSSRRVVITDTGTYLRRIRDLLGGYGLAGSNLQRVVVRLKNTEADNIASTIIQHLGGSASPAGMNGGAGGVVQASFTNSTGGRVVPDRETNSLVISGTHEEVAEIQSLICELDRAPPQVVLQGLIMEVNLGNTNELGAELGLQDSVLFKRSIIDNLVTLQSTNTSPNGVQTSNQTVLSQSSAPGFNFVGQPLGNNTAISPSTLGSQGFSSLGVGRTNSQLGFGGLVLSAGSNSVSLLLRALQAEFDVDVLSRPQIRTIDNEEAFIQIGQQVPVVDGVNVTAVGTANPVIRQDQAGIILRMTPHVSPDGMVQIKVIAEKSAFNLSSGSGVPIFTDARNGTVIQAPIKDITTAHATVSARAGQTIVLGGMITRDHETVQRRVPYLSRIPLLGRLFRYDYESVGRKELLIFLTPQLIVDDESNEMYKLDEVAKTHIPTEQATAMHGDFLAPSPAMQPASADGETIAPIEEVGSGSTDSGIIGGSGIAPR